jgi:hypothetical protein
VTRSRTIIATILAASMAATLPGCASNDARISGVVRVDGKPVDTGEVSFVSTTGLVFTAQIESDGSFRIEGVPAGSMRVLVFCAPQLPMFGDGLARAKMEAGRRIAVTSTPANAPPIPPRYSTARSSPLEVEVHAGDNHVPIDLTN